MIALGADLLDLSVKATLLCLAAAAVTGVMRRASAASRHVVWTAMFVAVLALPIARVLMPGLPVFVLAPQVLPVTPAAPLSTIPVPDSGAAIVPAASSPAAPTLVWPISEPVPPTAAEPVRSIPVTLGDVVVPLWLCGVFLLFVRAGVGRWRVRQLNRAASPLTDAVVLARVHELRRAFGVRRQIAVRASGEWMPMTWGVVHPVLLLPSNAVDADPKTRAVLEPLLVHEVAHVARFDAVSEAITRLVVALGWFNPLLWLAARQSRLERERACDDAVLAGGARASDYADQLVALADIARPDLTDGSPTLAMARRSQLELRVRSILDARTNRRSTSRASRLVAATLVIVAVPGAAVRLAARTVTPTPSQAEAGATPAPRAAQVEAAVVPEAARQRLPVTMPRTIQTVAPTVTAVLVDPAPQDAPRPPATVSSTYVIGVNDLLTITVWRSPELSGDIRVGSDGRITMPRGNPISAAGSTVAELKDAVTAELKRCCLASPDVIIQVKQIVSRTASGHSSFFFFNQDIPVDAARRSVPFATSFAQQPDWNALWRTLSARELEAEKNVALRVQIGTSTPLEPSEMKRARQALDSLVPWSQQPSDAELFALRSRFGEAVRNLDAIEVRFDNGLVSIKALADAYVAAAEALKRPSGVQFASATTPAVEARPQGSYYWQQTEYRPALSDKELMTALKTAATISPDATRADTLLALARAYAFTPDMVALYVDAARRIASDADRARVFAQAIRVK